jgi:hypothetical protein
MAKRPIFFVSDNNTNSVSINIVDFVWSPGLSIAQKQKSIRSLHHGASEIGINNILEISSKSEIPLGRSLSAFNLVLIDSDLGRLSVESAFQGSKKFAFGGPYIDLYKKSSLESKRDARLISSGELVSFIFNEKTWPLYPKSAFYDWLYLKALANNPNLADQLINYSAFTDIEFNPEKSFNCQAYSAALFILLHRRKLLDDFIKEPDLLIEYLTKYPSVYNNSQTEFNF